MKFGMASIREVKDILESQGLRIAANNLSTGIVWDICDDMKKSRYESASSGAFEPSRRIAYPHTSSV